MTARLPVIFIVGPTAVGKSAVAAALAEKINAEIISCDAMQVYREAGIVSDKPAPLLRARVAHHLIDVVSVKEEFSVARYRALAAAAVADIHARGKVPLITGGSGMYMMVLLDGIFEGAADPVVRAALETEDPAARYAELMRVDPAAAAMIKPGDTRRIVRALEVFRSTGVPISVQQKTRAGFWGQYDVRVFGLERPRAELYRRVEARVEDMFRAGLVAEVRFLLSLPLSSTGARIIGLPEIKGVLDGSYDVDRAKYLIKLHTRHYVKRQMTWFRKDKRVAWLMLGPQEAPGVTADRLVEKLKGS